MDYKSALRTASAAAQLETVSFAELVKAIGCKKLRVPPIHAATGNQYVHLVTADDQYVSIKVGKKCELTSSEPNAMLKELVVDFIIYTGETANGLWFTFGPEATAGESHEISLADFSKLAKLKASLVG